MELKEQITKDIKNNPVILYMKGTQDMPMCGFSYAVVQISLSICITLVNSKHCLKKKKFN